MNRKTCYFSFLSFDLELLKELKKKNHGILCCLLLLQRTWRNVSSGTELGNKSEWWVIRLCIYIPIPPALFQSFTRVLGFSSCAPPPFCPQSQGEGIFQKERQGRICVLQITPEVRGMSFPRLISNERQGLKSLFAEGTIGLTHMQKQNLIKHA